jgi:hypothetical protein
MIYLDEEHGVNPSLDVCFLCGGDKGVVLFGRLRNSTRQAFAAAGITNGGSQAPHRVTTDKEPCDKCKGYMELGVILVSIDEKLTTDRDNPYKTGGFVVVKDEALERMIHPQELLDDVLRRRLAFVPDDAWVMMGLPTPNKIEEQKAAQKMTARQRRIKSAAMRHHKPSRCEKLMLRVCHCLSLDKPYDRSTFHSCCGYYCWSCGGRRV